MNSVFLLGESDLISSWMICKFNNFLWNSGEDQYGRYSNILTKLFLAEGFHNQHSIYYANLDDDPREIVSFWQFPQECIYLIQLSRFSSKTSQLELSRTKAHQNQQHHHRTLTPILSWELHFVTPHCQRSIRFNQAILAFLTIWQRKSTRVWHRTTVVSNISVSTRALIHRIHSKAFWPTSNASLTQTRKMFSGYASTHSAQVFGTRKTSSINVCILLQNSNQSSDTARTLFASSQFPSTLSIW